MKNPADKTTWTDVCKKVGFRDNLYSDCRRNVEGFTGLDNDAYSSFGAGGPDDDEDEDLGTRIRKKALPIPAPPPDDWEYEPEGLMEEVMAGDLGKYMIYGGAAIVLAAIWFFWLRDKPAAAVTGGSTLHGIASQLSEDVVRAA